MVERTPFLNFFTHLILFVGFVFCIAPFVVVVIAASHNLRDVNDVPMSLLPGSDFWVNIKTAWVTADLGPKLRQTWSTMLLRHIGGQDIVHSFYDIVRLFYMDPPLETLREGEVELSKADVESLIELGPIIHEAYYRNMKNARVMVDGKLQPVIDGQARKAIYSNQKIAAKQAAMKDVVQSKVYI